MPDRDRSVDVLIVSYNTAPDLEACLASLEATYGSDLGTRIGVAVLDNASVDGTPEMVEGRFGWVELTRSPVNVYYGPAVNQLVAASRAEYVLLLNPDTIVATDILTPLVAALAEPGVEVAHPRLVGTDGVEQPSAQDFPTLAFEAAQLVGHRSVARWVAPVWDVDGLLARSFAPSDPGPQPMRFVWSTCCLLRRDRATALGPFAPPFPMYDTDLDLSRRMADSGAKATYLPDVVVGHRGGASSTSEVRRVMMAEGRRHYYRVHGTRVEAALFPLLQAVHGVVRARRRRRGR